MLAICIAGTALVILAMTICVRDVLRRRKAHSIQSCEHVWKLRLTPMSVDRKGTTWFHKTVTYSKGTQFLYICMKCGQIDTHYELFCVVENDLRGTPLGEMLEQYEKTVVRGVQTEDELLHRLLNTSNGEE